MAKLRARFTRRPVHYVAVAPMFPTYRPMPTLPVPMSVARFLP